MGSQTPMQDSNKNNQEEKEVRVMFFKKSPISPRVREAERKSNRKNFLKSLFRILLPFVLFIGGIMLINLVTDGSLLGNSVSFVVSDENFARANQFDDLLQWVMIIGSLIALGAWLGSKD